MSPLNTIFRRKSQVDEPATPNSDASNKQAPSATTQFDTVTQSNATSPSPQQAPNPSPMPPPHAVHSYPQHQSQMQNTGMAAGAAVGMIGGGGSNMVDGMIAGGVVGGMVGQHLAQAENHTYWRGQAMAYRGQLATGQQPAVSAGSTKQSSWWSREGREQRRTARWERRAKRRDGTTVNVTATGDLAQG
jgi:hypothetical protein